MKTLKEHFNRVYNLEKELFGKSFPVEGASLESQNKSLFKIGFHAGSLSKTVKIDSMRKLKNRRRFPGTTWLLNGEPMGWAILEVVS
jgi:CRISPR/Cas system CSM-associated protein Csm5 (group 7 of RAMP superfamily)